MPSFNPMSKIKIWLLAQDTMASGTEVFWFATERELMEHLIDVIDPENMKAIAAAMQALDYSRVWLLLDGMRDPLDTFAFEEAIISGDSHGKSRPARRMHCQTTSDPV